MDFTRNLKRYMSGDDVWEVKQKLLELGYLAKATHKKYGNDTYKAVKSFQNANGLAADGVVGKLTWAVLFPEPGPEPGPEPKPIVPVPDHISADIARKIGEELAAVSEIRQKICLEALSWASDATKPTIYLKGFYIRGGNAYNKDLTPNIMTKAKLTSYFKKTSYAPYFDGGRKEMMLAQCEADGYNKIGADCSGSIVGWWRKFKVVNSGFDANANSLYNSYCIKTTKPIPGDLAWKSGHIGLYVGAGYVVEFAGGAYGCQLTSTKKRKVYSYVDKKLHTMNGWTAYGDPKFY